MESTTKHFVNLPPKGRQQKLEQFSTKGWGWGLFNTTEYFSTRQRR